MAGATGMLEEKKDYLVTPEEAAQLKTMKSVLEEAVGIEWEGRDLRGVRNRLVEKLRQDVNWGYDIELRSVNYSSHEENKTKFDSDRINEIADRKIARHLFYDLGLRVDNIYNLFKSLYEQINGEAQHIMNAVVLGVKGTAESFGLKVEITQGTNEKVWYQALREIARKIDYHWGTELKAVKMDSSK